ncbi:hypothetical protein OPW32_17395 [Vibrio europaeus]|uniref:hypothetical protein n=1 Tax=Vibrio europaeus TaxID=300876 RepID=UPI0023417476|nr:hypothetical protein [Vibrio europaeus]MDC5850973.1 hypothetical protein [Vibrio europaeus]
MRTIFLLFILLSSAAFAGQQTGTVSWVEVRASDGLVYFGLSGEAATGQPPCATHSYWMIRDENSNSGRLQYSMLLSAQASGKQVSVFGMNTCIRWSDGEDVDSIKVK